MSESKWIPIVEKTLFVKFGLLTVLVLGLTLSTPAAHWVKTAAHKICQATLMAQSGCPTA